MVPVLVVLDLLVLVIEKVSSVESGWKDSEGGCLNPHCQAVYHTRCLGVRLADDLLDGASEIADLLCW